MTAGLPLMKSVLTPLAKNVLLSEKIKNKAREQKGGFLPKLLGTLVASM